MKTLSKAASAVLNALTANLEVGASRHVGEKGGCFMQVVVERHTDQQFSVSHYYEQNGDLVPDPDMEFYRFETGAWAPVSITQQFGFQRAIEMGDDGQPARFNPRVVRELCGFASMWMRNIKEQQGGLRTLKMAAAA